MKRASIVVAGAALLAIAQPSYATQGEHEYSAGLSAGSEANCSGAMLGPDGRWLLHATDFWAFGAGVRDRRCTGDWRSGTTSATAEARWTLDALTWIPSLAASAGLGRNRQGLTPTVRAEASMDWRGQPTWGVSVRVAHERDGWADTGRWMLTLAWVGYRGRGTGLDL